MKKVIIISILAVGLTAGLAIAQNGSWGMGGSAEYAMGSGMMGSGMMGPGMMGNGMGGNGSGFFNRPQNRGWGDAPPPQRNLTRQGDRFNGLAGVNKQKFLDDTVALRKKLNDKKFEYREALRDPNTSPETIANLEEQIQELNTRLDTLAQQYSQIEPPQTRR